MTHIFLPFLPDAGRVWQDLGRSIAKFMAIRIGSHTIIGVDLLAMSTGRGRALLFYVIAICSLLAAGPTTVAFSQASDQALTGSDAALQSVRWGLAAPDTADGTMAVKPISNALIGQALFHYIIPEEMSLARLSLCLKVPYGQLTVLNPTYEALKPFPKDTAVVVPLPFPIHPDMTPLKTDVLDNRFVAVYRTSLPFSRVQQLQDWYTDQLSRLGFRLLPTTNDMSAHSLQFASNRVALGSVEFSPGDESHPMLIDVAMMVRPFTGAFCAAPGAP